MSDQIDKINDILGATWTCQGKTFQYKDKLNKLGWTFVKADDGDTGYSHWVIHRKRKEDPAISEIGGLKGIWIGERK